MSDTCPHCGQRMLRRMGIQLSPKLADLFDVIQRRPAGIDVGTLIYVLYPTGPDRTQSQALNALKASIWLLNERLVEANYQIKTIPHRKSGIYAMRPI